MTETAAHLTGSRRAAPDPALPTARRTGEARRREPVPSHSAHSVSTAAAPAPPTAPARAVGDLSVTLEHTPTEPAAPPPGSVDLAGSLRGLLAAVDDEVLAVSRLSEQIDEHVQELNALRAEQAARLGVLDDLRGSVQDASLSAFLDRAVRPRRARVAEVVPERLTHD